MKKIIYISLFICVLASSWLLANRENKTTVVKWEDTADGIQFKKWEASPVGTKIQSAAIKINKFVKDSSKMEAVVTSLNLPEGSRLGYGVMVNIDGEDYILSFGPETNKEFEQLRCLQVNDKIQIKSRGVSKAPKYAYPIVGVDYVEIAGKIIYKKAPNKEGC